MPAEYVLTKVTDAKAMHILDGKATGGFPCKLLAHALRTINLEKEYFDPNHSPMSDEEIAELYLSWRTDPLHA